MEARRPKTYDAIKAIQFSVLSAREISAGSVADITTHESTENKGGQTYNKMGGLYDPRLGTITRGVPCLTCNQPMDTCPGHFGSTDLPTPFFHPEFMLTVMLIFRSICLCCCKPRLPHPLFCNSDSNADNEPVEINKHFLIEDPRARLLELSKNSPKKKNCALCYQYLPAVSKINDKFGWTISCEGRNDDGTPRVYEITATIAHRILCNITPEVAGLLGFSSTDPRKTRPEDLIWSVMAIPPPQLRPLITFDPMNKGQDDTTTSLYNILKSSTALLEATWASSEDNVRKCSDILSFQLRAMVNNDEKKKPCALQRSGRPLVGTKQRLEGKEGRFRGNLMGKRVDFSARTVITPDPNLDLDEVGVPYDVCMNLTFPECVTIDNIHFLQKLVNAGPRKLLGANFVERRLLSGALEKIDLSVKRLYVLVINVGDIVHRHLMDIDYILFNRQPSLHKMSMMGHRIHPLPGGTFRLNPSVTTPYNADFDGDEMNLHASQSIAARSETRHIMHVPKQIITPQSNRPIISLVQDTLLSCPILTSRSTLFSPADVYRLFQKETVPPCVHLVIPAVLYPRRLYTGKQVFSMIIPYESGKSITMNKLSSVYPDAGEKSDHLFSPTDSQVYIYNSMLICGILDKQTLGSSDGSLIHVITLQFSNDHTARFINSVQRVTDTFMQMHGYSIGITDMVIPDDLQGSIKTTIHTGYEDVSGVIGKFSASTDTRALVDMENAIALRLGQVRDICGRLVQQNMTQTRGNSIVNMVNSGSKGSSINISQIMACVGPQEVLGKRIQLTSDGRSLPYFHRGSLSPESRGMVKSPFIYGLSVSEFYYHMMAGREGMIDTAVKTSETGYIQRRLFKSMEALIVQYDGTVRNAQGKIIQYAYGEDAMNAVFLESVNCVLYGITDAAFDELYLFENASSLYVDHISQLRHDRQFVNDVLTDKRMCMPFCIPRIIAEGVPATTSIIAEGDPDPDSMIHQLLSFETKLGNTGWGSPSVNANQISLIMVYIRSELSPKRAILRGISGLQFASILNRILVLYARALIEPGESVGGLAAQSIGEPATQMTLNSVAPSSVIMIHDSFAVHITTIGEFIDCQLSRYPKKIEHIPANRTEYLKLKGNWSIAAPDAHGNVEWQKVTAVTRHLPVGDLVHIKTRSGREVMATQSKSVLVFDPNTQELVQRDGSSVSVGDLVPVIYKMPDISYPGDVFYDNYRLGYSFGTVIGACVSRVCVITGDTITLDSVLSRSVIKWLSSHKCGVTTVYINEISNLLIGNIPGTPVSGQTIITSDRFASLMSDLTLMIPEHLMTAPIEFVKGFISAYIPPAGRNENFYTSVAFMYSRLGIHASILTGKPVGDLVEGKQNDVILDPIVSIEMVPATKFVYDLTVPVTTNFSLWNGLGVADTFHFAGVASQSQVTTGVPRLNEIINLSRKFQTPSMKIKLLSSGDPELDLLNSQKFQHSIGILSLRDYVVDYTVIRAGPFDVPDPHLQLFYADDMNTLLTLSGCYAKITVSAVKLIVSGVSIHDITNSIYDLMNDKVLVRVVEVPAYITHKFPDHCHTLFVYFPSANFALTDDILDIIHTVTDNIINNITVTGLPGITRVYPAKDNCVETCGVNMTSIFANENVDYAHTTTNDIYVVYEELGVEAARACILRELQTVLTFGGKYVNIRHLSLLVDTMCNSGLMSITRHGMNRKKSGVFMRASFEETLSVLVSAAIFSEKDHLVDVTSNIIMGKLSKIGTGFFDVLLDTEKVISAYTNSYSEVSASNFLSDLSNALTTVPVESRKRDYESLGSPGVYQPEEEFRLRVYSPSRDDDYCPYSPSYQ